MYICLSLNVAIKLKSEKLIDILFIGSPSNTLAVSWSILYIAKQCAFASSDDDDNSPVDYNIIINIKIIIVV